MSNILPYTPTITNTMHFLSRHITDLPVNGAMTCPGGKANTLSSVPSGHVDPCDDDTDWVSLLRESRLPSGAMGQRYSIIRRFTTVRVRL